MADILEIYGRSAQAIRAAHREFLTSQGVSRRTLIEAGLVGVSRVHMSGGSFEFSDDGEPAFISPVHELRDGGRHLDPFPATADLLAWLPRKPKTFARWLGVAMFLGEPYLRAAMEAGEAIRVYRTPLDWLRAGCAGVVILDTRRAWAEFGSLEWPLVADDVEHGRELRRILTPPQQYGGEILVARSEIAA